MLADVAARQSRRKTELLGRGLASSEETEKAKGDADAGAASCAARRASARVSESAIASAEARVARYQAEIERSFIRAPFAGRVLDVHARPGEIVGLDGDPRAGPRRLHVRHRRGLRDRRPQRAQGHAGAGHQQRAGRAR